MAWDPTKPANTDLTFNSVGSTAIRNNFAAIDTAWDINHVGIGDTNQGKHKAIHIRDTGAPTTIADEIALYSTDYAGTTQGSELYFRRESNGSAYPITASNRSADNGWTFLPSGILLKWGYISTAGGSQSTAFPTGATYPAFTAVYRAFLQPVDSDSVDTDDYVRLRAVSTTHLSYYGSARTTTGPKAMAFHWLVIGLGV